ncbi:MAG TPA: hypothetical protein VJM10_02940, partial [Candidatus Methylomirabilis sp.]|nr:hypothetical protein [Candidatus Methylomirabilis sp.]
MARHPVIPETIKLRRSKEFRKVVKPAEAVRKDAVSVVGLDLSHTSTGICTISPVLLTGELLIEAMSVGADLREDAT